jgi:aspartyl/asparaginyl beta-hydroxylase (cupin superfamily)
VGILDGLSDGDQVIVANLGTFRPGERVTPHRSAMANMNADAGEDQ